MNKLTTISISKETKERLDNVGKKGQTYNDIVAGLLDTKAKQNKFPWRGR